MALKLFICVLSERHIDDSIELCPNEIKAIERANEWMDHFALGSPLEWEHNPKDKTWLHQCWTNNREDGPRARIVEVELDLGLLSDFEAKTLVKVMAGNRAVCPDCDGTGRFKYMNHLPCETCSGAKWVKR